MNKLILFLMFSFSSFAQTVVSGDLENYINNYLSNIPSAYSSNEYQVPHDSVLNQWAEVIVNIFYSEYDSADIKAAAFGYQIVNFTDTLEMVNKDYIILEGKPASANFWGMFLFNPAPLRQKLVVQAPHPLYDSNTGKESLIIFKRSGARALFISGTHRCNSSAFTTCSGTTTACGGSSQSYRLSDLAHVVNSTFQKTTEVLSELIENMIVLQPHGFAKLSSDPYLIMSNGTQLTPPGTDYLLLLNQNLFSLDSSLTFKIAHIDLNWTRLIATTNTQGRLLNGSINPCNLNPAATSGRFLHVEQAYTKLRDTKSNWIKFADAVAMTFPEDPIIGVKEGVYTEPEYFLYPNYPNPFNPVTTVKYKIKKPGFVSLKVFDILGRNIAEVVSEEQSASTYSYIFDGHDLSSGVYFIVLNVDGNVISNKVILAK